MKRLSFLVGGLAALTLVLPGARGAADRVLFEVNEGVRPSDLIATDVVARESSAGPRSALRVRTGTRESWPGITWRSPAEGWDLSAYARVEVHLRNSGTNAVKVFCRVDNPGADGTRHCVTGELALAPGKSGVLPVPLQRTSGDPLGGQLFGLRGYPVRAGGERTVDAARVTQVLVFVHQPAAPHEFEIERIVATGDYTRPTAWVTDADPYLPFIDEFGQYRHRNWPGKIGSREDLMARREAEERELSQNPGPEGWTRYGGWAAGPQREATGFFRVEKYRGKWWLVDPEGRLFWSHGVDCVASLGTTVVEGRAAWFDGFPGDQPEGADFVVPTTHVLMGHYAGRSPRGFSFDGMNRRRKYGPAWRPAYADLVHRRLRSWGMNTIANWSDLQVARLRRTPYTDSVSSRGARMIEGSEGYWGKFPDVFDPGFAGALRRDMARKREGSAGDPWCLGYFSDNELSWGDEVSLAEATLRSPADQAAKRAFLDDLKSTYGGIEALNARWGTAHVSWDALREARAVADRAKARRDLEAFYSRVADRYFATVRAVIREIAPRQLYLGCRFAWANPRAAAAAARHGDVVSYNLYQRSIADFQFDGGADVPLIVGEFHFGALDRGMFHTGLVPVPNQAARARAYREYVEGALRHPQFVGTHWFQWQDQPTTGRSLDEENYQIGLVDIADTPYPETIEALRAVGRHLYDLRLGNP